jgi:hypothetical protein
MVEGVNSSMIYLIHCKNFYKCHNVHSPSPTIKKERKKENEVHRAYGPWEARVRKLEQTRESQWGWRHHVSI